MGKYLVLWEIDQNRVPISPQERGTGWAALLDMVKETIKKGKTKDWGTFVGETNGYSIFEGTEVELANELQLYVPWTIFKVKQVASVKQVEEVIKALTK